ncbi:hypothetical protein BDB01DRAFT_830423 [Pilobolus umbonatus]|nr:hypothetical protein BDB01DRAFT_830423 [Pilobolus umbonatus]
MADQDYNFLSIPSDASIHQRLFYHEYLIDQKKDTLLFLVKTLFFLVMALVIAKSDKNIILAVPYSKTNSPVEIDCFAWSIGINQYSLEIEEIWPNSLRYGVLIDNITLCYKLNLESFLVRVKLVNSFFLILNSGSQTRKRF